MRAADGAAALRNWRWLPQTGAAASSRLLGGCLRQRPTTDTPDSVLVGRMPLAAIIDFLPGTFYVINRDGRFVLWNRKLERSDRA